VVRGVGMGGRGRMLLGFRSVTKGHSVFLGKCTVAAHEFLSGLVSFEHYYSLCSEGEWRGE
jgi:hypothetical protein